MGSVKVLGPLCRNLHRYRNTFKSLRYASTRQCVMCHRAWSKKYNQLPTTKEKSRISALKYHWQNRDTILPKKREYSKTEGYKLIAKKSRVKHRDMRNAITRDWKQRNKTHVSKYNRRYAQTERGRNTIRAKESRRRLRSGFITYTISQLQSRMRRLGNKCIYCGASGKITVDHLIPLADGGFECLTNLVPACRSCNVRKSKIHPLVWIERLSNCDDRLRRRVSRLIAAYKKSIRGRKRFS